MVDKNKDNEALDEEEIEDEDEEGTASEQEESSKGEKKDDAEPKKEGEEEIVEEEGDEASTAKKAEEDGKREEIRERRRREKKMRKERDKREKMQMQNLIVGLQEEVKKLREGPAKEFDDRIGAIERSKVEEEMQQLGNVYQNAKAEMERAIRDNDGATFVKAKEISDKAWARYNLLELQKNQRPGNAKATGGTQTQDRADLRQPVEREQAGSQQQEILNNNGIRLGKAWATKHSTWYDAQANNRESKVVQAIDLELYSEGYDPNEKEYWDELDDRVKEILPHRFVKQPVQNRSRQIVGGGSQDGAPSSSQEKALPAEFVKTLKAAGYWDDPAKKKAAIKNYYANRQQRA